MGVSGTGKSTIGKMLSKELNIPFFDGDDFHPEANVLKMASGQPLNDEDRYDWLISLNELAKKHKNKGVIIACSALKASYREILKNDMDTVMRFIHLEGSFDLIQSRMKQRSSHFMPAKLLESQFATLETPEEALNVSIVPPPDKIVAEILSHLDA